MSERLENVLTRIRHNLSDIKKQKWSDERLKILIDEAQNYLNKHHGVLTVEEIVYIEPLKIKYTLSNDIVFIKRAESYNFGAIDFYHYSDMDFRNRYFKTSVGEVVEAIVYGGEGEYNTIEIYPAIRQRSEFYSIIPDNYGSGLYISIENDVNSNVVEYDGDGVVVDFVSNKVVNVLEDIGVVVDFVLQPSVDIIKVYYVRTCKSVFVIDDIDLPAIYDDAISYYATYRAYLDYTDRDMIVKSREFVNLFNAENVRLKGLTTSSNKYVTKYIGYDYKIV